MIKQLSFVAICNRANQRREDRTQDDFNDVAL